MSKNIASPARFFSLLFLAILLSGLNMRAVLTGMGPVLDDIRASLSLSPSTAGLLVTLPTLCFGIFSIVMPRIIRGIPAHRVMVAGLLILAAGIALRSTFGVPGLFLGIFIASVGISAMMVVIPAITKSTFSHRLSVAMSFYTMSFCLGASLGAGLAVPLANLPHSSWHWSLAFWSLPALAAALVWALVPASTLPKAEPPSTLPASWQRLYRDKLAWKVTLVMGLQACLGQSLVTWLPAMLTGRGISPVQAGVVLSLGLLIQLVSAFAAPWLSMRGRDQRLMLTTTMGMMIAGMLGILYAPIGQVWLWTAMMGLGMGGNFSLSLSLLVLRARTTQDATALSGMAQGIGYMIAAMGPVLAGILYQYSNNWHTVAGLFVILGLISCWAGLGAGRKGFILADTAN